MDWEYHFHELQNNQLEKLAGVFIASSLLQCFSVYSSVQSNFKALFSSIILKGVPSFKPIVYKTKTTCDLVSRVFPRFRHFACGQSFEISEAPADIFWVSGLSRAKTNLLFIQHSIELSPGVSYSKICIQIFFSSVVKCDWNKS